MHTAKRPYWHGPLDRWNVLIAAALALFLIVLDLSGVGQPLHEPAPVTPVAVAPVTPMVATSAVP